MHRESFLLETRADSMVRAAQSLYLLSDSLKLSLLLSQSQMSESRDQEAQQLIDKTDSHMRRCGELLAQRWLPGATAMPDSLETSGTNSERHSHCENNVSFLSGHLTDGDSAETQI